MRIKELKRTVNVCWSPAEHYPITLAAGSAAQQVDASFSSSSHLELYSLNLEDPGVDLELKSSLQTQHKFQKLVWSGAGVIVGGCDGGLLQFYSADKLLNNASDCLLGSSTKHNGHVSALDINPYQKNLLASGASDSEIYIWDLNNTSQPMAPGTRNQPYDHVQGLAWNQQVQHILGSTFATRCVVWDLRKNEPIMKLSDSQSRTRWRALAWHPSVATQLCIASEDDQVPVIQLWDLRLAASPLATLEGHNKGVMAVSWCRQDPDMLLSGGKDGRVLCWNPNNTKPGGEILSEISEQQQWVFEVSWCPRDPNLLSAASFDQHVAVHCLLGGARPDVSPAATSSIVESFGGAASFSQLPAVARAPAPAAAHHQPPTPPAWLKRPSAAKFAFGGKLLTFEKCPQEAGPQKLVYISQVVSEPEIVEQAAELDSVLGSSISQEAGSTEKLAEYCRQKGDAAMDQNERYVWFFLRANFLPTFRTEVLNLLGFKQDEIPSKFKSAAVNAGDGQQPDLAALSRGESTETEAELSTDTSTDLSDAHTLIERKLANIEITSSANNVAIPNGEDMTSLICRALVCGNLEEAVELCLDAGRVSDAMIVASLGSQDLVYKVQKYHLNATSGDPVSLLAGSLLQSRWDQLVQSAAPACWKDTLATLLTHCDAETLEHYCEMLGDKLSQESDPALSAAATLCYVCGASPTRAARGGMGRGQRAALALLLRRAAALRGRALQSDGGDPAVCEYASRLAAQGCLHSALLALADLPAHPLRDRLEGALAMKQTTRQVAAPAQPRARSVSSHSRAPLHEHNPFSTTAAPFEQPAWQQGSVPGVPYQQRQYQPHQQQPQPPPTQPLQPLQPQLPQPPQQPARPASVGPHGGLPSRSKYKVDPSVAAAPMYNQYSYNNQTQPYGGFNSPLPDQYSSASIPGVPNTFAPINPVNSMNLNPPQLNPMNPLNPAPLNPMNPLNPAPLNPAPMNPAVNGGYYGAQQAVEPPPHSKPAPAGWNDPPMVTSKPKPKQEAPTSQAPITHPLFGVEPQHVPLAPAPAQYPGQYPPQQYPGQQYPGQHPGQQYQEQQYQQYPPAMQPAYQQHTEAPAPVEPASVQKAPLPEEHLVLQQVFDSLRADCATKAVNVQMKRKLEDVQRRLETLYDLLREYRLSEATLGALHSCSQLVQAGDFGSATQTVAALASGSDFAAAAAFLPGLKALLQLAAQLQR
ncbi:hypothetical protein O3G_MSEX008653 [Manduca sexta]|uniref:Protein transport protein Sec31A n=1 Tax=Manduca sexta TaxID=7130 RepID=A0A921ZAK1_MANSE|nr:hypothetical protein O3G_MSEX008653 [Manduca sexta]